MAEQKQAKTPEQEKKEKEQREQEYRFNRQINYYIMRHMWQVIRGRNANDRIYECFGMSRERYTRAINTGKIRCSNEEAKRLEQLTGISRKVFLGEERINCRLPNKKEPAIPEEAWRKLFAWRNNTTKDNEAGENLKKQIHNRLKRASKTDTDTFHFFQLCYFLKENKPAPLKKPDEQMRVSRYALRTLTFELLMSCDMLQLQEMNKLLQEKLEMVNGIMTYRKEREKAKGYF